MKIFFNLKFDALFLYNAYITFIFILKSATVYFYTVSTYSFFFFFSDFDYNVYIIY